MSQCVGMSGMGFKKRKAAGKQILYASKNLYHHLTEGNEILETGGDLSCRNLDHTTGFLQVSPKNHTTGTDPSATTEPQTLLCMRNLIRSYHLGPLSSWQLCKFINTLGASTKAFACAKN